MKNEIRFTLESKQRPKLAQEIGNILGTVPHYERVPSCAYDIAGYRLDKEGVLHIPEGAEETTKDLIRQLRERGFQDDAEVTEEVPVQEDKLTIGIPRESLTDTALENLQRIIANRQTLFQRAFRMDSTEIEITEEKINFTWFPYTTDSDEMAAYTQFISRLCDMARDAKGYHQSRPKRIMTNMLSAVFCSDLALSEKSIRQQERFCLEILREIQHSATENKDKMTWGVGADRCPFSMGKTVGATCGR